MDKVCAHLVERLSKGQAPEPFMSWLPLWGDPKHKAPEMTHKWGYFRADMDLILKAAGFIDIKHEDARYHFPFRDMRVTAIKSPEAA